MVYRVTDSEDNIIASGEKINIGHGGVLEVADAEGGVDLFLAPGSWASAFWEDNE